MKIGIYGGTFDPVHNGHISIAKAVKNELGLSKVFFVAAADPPHKHDPSRTPAAVRFKMMKQTLRYKRGLIASDIEIARGGVSYTAETLEQFKKLYPEAELYFIVGADMLANFPTWYRPDRILELSQLTAVQRMGQEEDLKALEKRIETDFGGNIVVTRVCGPDISSTEVRRRMLEAKPISDIVPFQTELFIYENMLYMPDELKQIKEKLAGSLDPERLRHSLLTVREAILLAEKHGLDTEKARLCALVHDCAKLRGEKLSACMRRVGFVPTADEEQNPYLIHARLGAMTAKAEFSIEDPEILTAIERHTLGSPDMTPFDEVIFLADKLEPTREYRSVASMRKLAYKNLDEAVAAVIRNNVEYTESIGKPVHSSTMSTLAAIESRIKS